jgi:DNA-binding NtrC family response regulator
VGSTDQRHADIRVVSATHRDLDQMVSSGTFREDLYYRLSTFPIHLPSLRERRDDIALLAKALLVRVAPQRKLRLGESALGVLQAQDYPGNVRELRNLLERAALMCDGDTLEEHHVQQALRSGRRPPTPAPAQQAPAPKAAAPLLAFDGDMSVSPGGLKRLELAALAQLVGAHQGSRAELARKLGISERSLYRKLKALA